jgi:hypothetical protein
MSRIEAIIGDANLNGTDTKRMALRLKNKIKHMGGGGQSNPPSTQSSGSSTAESMEKELATMKSNLETVRTELAEMRAEQANSFSRIEKALATLVPTESLDGQGGGKVAKREGVIKEEGSGNGKRQRNS